MTELSASEIMIQENTRKLMELKKYEAGHRNSFFDRAVYYAVEHEIEYLEKQNKELEV